MGAISAPAEQLANESVFLQMRVCLAALFRILQSKQHSRLTVNWKLGQRINLPFP